MMSSNGAAIRLAEAEYITQPELRSWERVFVRTRGAEKQEEKEAAGDSFGPPHAKRVSELGYFPTYLAKLAVDQKMIDSVDVQLGLSLSSTLQEKAFSLAARRFEVAVGK